MLPPCRPQEISDIKKFLTTARRKDAKSVTVLTTKVKGKDITKFKIRCTKVRPRAPRARAAALSRALLTPPPPPHTHTLDHQYLWTLKVTDQEKANKLRNSLPPGLERIDLGKAAKKATKA